jgi:hypothetical protein
VVCCGCARPGTKQEEFVVSDFLETAVFGGITELLLVKDFVLLLVWICIFNSCLLVFLLQIMLQEAIAIVMAPTDPSR